MDGITKDSIKTAKLIKQLWPQLTDVDEEYRLKDIAKNLCTKCEEWAKNKGCKEFASDCTLTNTDSIRFHLNIGFQEANRIIHFKKKL